MNPFSTSQSVSLALLREFEEDVLGFQEDFPSEIREFLGEEINSGKQNEIE